MPSEQSSPVPISRTFRGNKAVQEIEFLQDGNAVVRFSDKTEELMPADDVGWYLLRRWGCTDEIEVLRTQVHGLISQLGRSHHTMIARSKADELLFWLRAHMQRQALDQTLSQSRAEFRV